MENFETNSTPPSYVDKTKKIKLLLNFVNPTEEQGIIFEYFGENKILDYLVAFNSIINKPIEIIAPSRAGNNRIIIFLSSKELTSSILSQHQGFQLGDRFVKINKLKPTSTKIIFWHVFSVIPILPSPVTNPINLKIT